MPYERAIPLQYQMEKHKYIGVSGNYINPNQSYTNPIFNFYRNIITNTGPLPSVAEEIAHMQKVMEYYYNDFYDETGLGATEFFVGLSKQARETYLKDETNHQNWKLLSSRVLSERGMSNTPAENCCCWISGKLTHASCFDDCFLNLLCAPQAAACGCSYMADYSEIIPFAKKLAQDSSGKNIWFINGVNSDTKNRHGNGDNFEYIGKHCGPSCLYGVLFCFAEALGITCCIGLYQQRKIAREALHTAQQPFTDICGSFCCPVCVAWQNEDSLRRLTLRTTERPNCWDWMVISELITLKREESDKQNLSHAQGHIVQIPTNSQTKLKSSTIYQKSGTINGIYGY